MPAWTPLIVIALALMAAGCIAFIAWELTSKRFQDSIDHRADAED